MTIEAYIRNKCLQSTGLLQYTTQVYSMYAPTDINTPFILIRQVGADNKRLMRQRIMQLVSYSNTLASADAINEALYLIFDNSTKITREKSSSLYIDSVQIVNNAVSLYDDDKKTFVRSLDISIWYHK